MASSEICPYPGFRLSVTLEEDGHAPTLTIIGLPWWKKRQPVSEWGSRGSPCVLQLHLTTFSP